ncbi:unnamed protein product, partial [Didymodactylos carnosus]
KSNCLTMGETQSTGASGSYTYSQSKKTFCNDNTRECKPAYSGYKGETDQTKRGLGPIPKGSYTIENSCKNDRERCNLKPDTTNNMYGRDRFQIHGDNGKNDQSASQGCIIVDKNGRRELNKGDRVYVTD